MRFNLPKILLFLIYIVEFSEVNAVISPVVLVPGDGGSRLQAKLNKPTTVSSLCEKTTSGYEDLWISLEEFTPISLPCFTDNMRLVYDPKAHITKDSPGVTVRAPGFGGTETVSWLHSYHLYSTGYFSPIVEMLKKNLGYKENQTVFGAPYDFRRAINEQSAWFDNVTKLIEHAYKINNNTPVTIVAHSMGNSMTLYLLHNKPKEWKNKYIKRWIAISGPWGGTVKPIRAIVSGVGFELFGIFGMSPLIVRSGQRSWPSTHFLTISPQFWNSSAVLAANIGVKNYTLDNLEELYYDLNITNEWQMFQDSRNMLDPTRPPEVEVHCLHGKNVPTPYQYQWSRKNQWPDSQPDVVNGPGDGTVVHRSLEGCLKWRGKQSEPFSYYMIDKIEHLAAVSNNEVINYVHKTLAMDTPLATTRGFNRLIEFTNN